MTSFLVRNGSIFVRSCCSFVDQLLLLRLELRDLLVERLQLGLRERLALERHAGEVLAALGQRLARLGVELDDLLLELRGLHLKALLRRDDVGDALLDVLEQLDLLLVAVVERLAGVLGPVEQPRDLRLDDGGHPTGQPGHAISSFPTRSRVPPSSSTPRPVEPRSAVKSQPVLTRWMGIADANTAGYVHGGVDHAPLRRGGRHRGRAPLRLRAS